MPQPSLQQWCASKKVCVVYHVNMLCTFGVNACAAEFALLRKHLCQREICPKQLVDRVERGGNSQNYLLMVNGLFRLASVSIYSAENTMSLASQKLESPFFEARSIARVRLPPRRRVVRRCVATKQERSENPLVEPHDRVVRKFRTLLLSVVSPPCPDPFSNLRQTGFSVSGRPENHPPVLSRALSFEA